MCPTIIDQTVIRHLYLEPTLLNVLTYNIQYPRNSIIIQYQHVLTLIFTLYTHLSHVLLYYVVLHVLYTLLIVNC